MNVSVSCPARVGLKPFDGRHREAEGSVSSRGWAVIGAVGGGIAFAQLGMLALLVAPGDAASRILALPALIVSVVVGLLVGARLGSRVPQMPRSLRISFGALTGLAIGAAIGGSAWLYVIVTSQDFPHGMAAFVKGAIVGGLVGAALGGALMSVEARPRPESL